MHRLTRQAVRECFALSDWLKLVRSLYLQAVLADFNGNQCRAADALCISRATLSRQMACLGIAPALGRGGRGGVRRDPAERAR